MLLVVVILKGFFFINVANLITPMECHDPMTRCSIFGHENEWFIIMIIVISY